MTGGYGLAGRPGVLRQTPVCSNFTSLKSIAQQQLTLNSTHSRALTLSLSLSHSLILRCASLLCCCCWLCCCCCCRCLSLCRSAASSFARSLALVRSLRSRSFRSALGSQRSALGSGALSSSSSARITAFGRLAHLFIFSCCHSSYTHPPTYTNTPTHTHRLYTHLCVQLSCS